MKRILLLTLLVTISFLIASCVDIVGTVKSIQITEWTPSEYYEVGEDVDLTDVEVVVSFDAADDQTFTLADTDVSVRGSGVAFDGTDVSLNTTEEGEKRIIISYDTVSVTVEFNVVEHLVRAAGTNDGTAIQAIIDAAGFEAGDTLYFAAGEYDIDVPILLNKTNISMIGSEYGTSKLVSGSHVVIFNVDEKGITIENLTMTTTHIGDVQDYNGRSYAGIISLRDGAGNTGVEDWQTDFNAETYTVVKNNVIFGSYSAQYNYDEMDWFGIACNYQEDTTKYTGSYNNIKMSYGTLYAEGNTIYNVRQSIQLGRNNVGLIYDNTMFNTKGGILTYHKELIQAQSDEWLNNSWLATVDGFRDYNEQDIVFHSGTDIPTGDWADWHSYDRIITLSDQNNGANVVDRRVYAISADGPQAGDYREDRTHVYIRNQSADENPFFDDSADNITGMQGHVRLPLWAETLEKSVRIALGFSVDGIPEPVEGLIDGGVILYWDEVSESYVVYPPENYPTE